MNIESLEREKVPNSYSPSSSLPSTIHSYSNVNSNNQQNQMNIGRNGMPIESQKQIHINQTLYINNINEKIKKRELKYCLYGLFSQYGQILDIVAMKGIKMRGQAFIVYKDVASAIASMKALQGYPFFDKPIKIQFAKEKSLASIEFEQFVMEPFNRQSKV